MTVSANFSDVRSLCRAWTLLAEMVPIAKGQLLVCAALKADEGGSLECRFRSRKVEKDAKWVAVIERLSQFDVRQFMPHPQQKRFQHRQWRPRQLVNAQVTEAKPSQVQSR